MSDTKHQGICTAVAALFAGMDADSIEANRERLLATDETSRIDVMKRRSVPSMPVIDGAPIDWVSEIDVVIRGRAAGGVAAEAVVDALVGECFARVMADQDLGGLAQFAEPGEIEWDPDQAEVGVERAALRFSFTHCTQNNVIT